MEPDASTKSVIYDFEIFLREHRYAPQGRYSRVGDLNMQDLEMLTRGKLASVWRWTFATIKNASGTQLIQRNLVVARKKIESYRIERDAEKEVFQGLCARRTYLMNALEKSKRQQKELLHRLRALEEDRKLAADKELEDNKRFIICEEYESHNENFLLDLIKELELCLNLMKRQKMGPQVQRNEAINAVEQRIQHFMKDLHAFGEKGDMRDLLSFGGMQLKHAFLTIAKNRRIELVPIHKQPKEANLDADPPVKTPEETIAQVKNVLRSYQKKLIAQFLECQTLYIENKRVKGCIRTKQVSIDGSEALIALDRQSRNDVELDKLRNLARSEIRTQALTNTLETAKELCERLQSQIDAYQQQEVELDRRITNTKTYEKREEDMLLRLRDMQDKSRARIQDIRSKQRQIQETVAQYTTQLASNSISKRLLEWQSLIKQEIRTFSKVHLPDLDKVSKYDVIAGYDSTERSKKLIPQYKLLINQIRDSEARLQPSNASVPKVLTSMGIPAYGNWLLYLDALTKANTSQASLIQLLSQLEQEFSQDTLPDHRNGSVYVQRYLSDLTKSWQKLETTTLPMLSSTKTLTDKVVGENIPRMQRTIQDWASQSAWKLCNHAMDASNEGKMDIEC